MKQRAFVIGSIGVVGLAWAVMASAAPRQDSDSGFDAVAALNARTMLDEGKKSPILKIPALRVEAHPFAKRLRRFFEAPRSE